MAKLSRAAIRKIWEDYVSAYLLTERFGIQASPQLPEYKAEVDKIPDQEILAAIQPTEAEQLKFRKKHLLDLLIQYRVQLALDFQPDVDDLWHAVLAMVDTAEDIPVEQVSLPYYELDPMKYQLSQTRGSSQSPQEPYEPRVRRLILELRRDLSDDAIKKLVAKAMAKHKPLQLRFSFSEPVGRYLDGFLPTSEPSSGRKPRGPFDSLLGRKKNSSPAKKFELLPIDDLLERYHLWESQPIEDLHELECIIMGYIEAYKRICKLKPDEIEELLVRAYKSWHYRVSKTIK